MCIEVLYSTNAYVQSRCSMHMFCSPIPAKVPKKTHYISRKKGITRELLGWPTRASCPEGHWSKGSLTTTLMEFGEHIAGLNNLEQCEDERLRLVASGLTIGSGYTQGLKIPVKIPEFLNCKCSTKHVLPGFNT